MKFYPLIPFCIQFLCFFLSIKYLVAVCENGDLDSIKEGWKVHPELCSQKFSEICDL